MIFDLVVRNTSRVVTCGGRPTEAAATALAPIERGAVGISHGRVAFLGPEAELPENALSAATRIIDARRGLVGPGFVRSPHAPGVRRRAGEGVRAAQRGEELPGDRQGRRRHLQHGERHARGERGGAGRARAAPPRPAARAGRHHRGGEERLWAHPGARAEDAAGGAAAVRHAAGGAGAHAAVRARAPAGVRAGPRRIPARVRGDDSRLRDGAAGPVLRCLRGERAPSPMEEARRLFQAARGAGLVPRLHADQLTANGGAQLAADVGASSRRPPRECL